MLSATCHCQAVRVEVPAPPASVTDCNCSVCRRYGVLWAYYPAEQVRVDAEAGSTDVYAWGPKALNFVRCSQCGCVTHWERVVPVAGTKMGVNARLFPAGTLQGVEVEPLDGASYPV